MSGEELWARAAEVRYGEGRWWLLVANVALAMEGDPCRDGKCGVTPWTLDLLWETAERLSQRLTWKKGEQ